MTDTTLTISSKNYSSWSMRGWLLCKMAGIDFQEIGLSVDDPAARAELLHLSPSFLVPALTHDGIKIWDTLAIGEYLNEIAPEAGLLPQDKALRARCRSICGEMHQGFFNMRSALPMNIKGHYDNFKIWTGVQADIDRVLEIWRGCLGQSGGPYLFGKLSMADAMYAPVCTRFATYDVTLPDDAKAYCKAIMEWPAVAEWIADARAEPEELDELDAEF